MCRDEFSTKFLSSDNKDYLITLKVQLFSLRGAYTEPEPKEENPHG